MIPIALDPARVRMGLTGRGPHADRRLRLLRGGGADVRICTERSSDEALRRQHLLWIVGLPEADALALAERARALGVLVNVEDVREGCDFHNVAEVRRGNLLLTVSTNGRSPGLAALIRGQLAEMFGPEWGERVERAASARDAARASGRSMAEVAKETSLLVGAAGWLG